jgi:2-oxo-4-hydroxy-4-carboxy-5-ureidoimidazoline decarboxylase
VAAASASARVWLVTTNDNVDAIRWYLRQGLVVAEVHAGAVDRDREALKPALPANGAHGIPIHDLVELQHDLADGETLTFRAFPRISDVDALPPEAAAHVIAPLFEDAPRFLGRLVAERPFRDDDGLLARAWDVARTMPEDEQMELLGAHPRIGADAATVSPLSHAEQGYGDAAPPEQPWIADELELLNEAYERIFGFRFVVFVAGRPRSAIVPILEASLRDERVSELRRGVDDVVHIAADRLRRLRGLGR